MPAAWRLGREEIVRPRRQRPALLRGPSTSPLDGRIIMRAAVLLSGLFLLCGAAAFVGVPSVHVGGRPVVGLTGLFAALVLAAVPPILVFGWRKMRGR